MGSKRALLLLLALTTTGVGCATGDPRRFQLRTPVVRDQDLDAVGQGAPKEYESSFAWDAADNSLFRPISKFFQADYVGESKNVNAFDEVPDSSWFVNRIGVKPMTPDEAAAGFCPTGVELHSNPPDKAWFIDYGKDNGANPGFRVNVEGTKFMFKTDDTQPERATAATAIASRFYYAAGWWAPCDAVVYFKRSALRLKPGLKVKANTGPAKNFDDKLLDATLEKTGRRGDTFRATASRFVIGKPIGPFTYEGKRSDDPSDVIEHEDRRDLRGARIIAAWLNHFDSREQNTMSTWIAENEKDPKSKGHVRHWYIDLGDCFGSEWDVDGFSRRHGFSYIFDVNYMLEDFGTLGIIERPWDTARRTPGHERFGYFTSAKFDPDYYRGEYPNPAFSRMTEHDAAWGTRIIARFTPAHIAATVKVGDFTSLADEEFLTRILVERREILLRRYFAKLSPLTDVSVAPGKVCATDLARWANVYDASKFAYTARVRRARGTEAAAQVTVEPEGRVCVDIPSTDLAANVPDNSADRYVVTRIRNGTGSGDLVLHFYDLGSARGMTLVGIERP